MGVLVEIFAHHDDEQAPPTANELETLALMEQGVDSHDGATEKLIPYLPAKNAAIH